MISAEITVVYRRFLLMRITTWNINGLRSLKAPLKTVLDSLESDIICVQETKVTRDALPEDYAIVDGYHSFYSYSRLRTGYSGVATFCKYNFSPSRAEEGLSGRFVRHLTDKLGGDYSILDQLLNEEDLVTLDKEGRTVVTEHRLTDGTILVIFNVYCPRADPNLPERLEYKLKFFKALEARARYFLQQGSRIIIVGDLNVSHKLIDTCDPGDLEDFELSPSRKWLNGLLNDSQFTDTFRHFYPTELNAYTCWSTVSRSRVHNYGTRIDYIIADSKTVNESLASCLLRPDILNSDHCPVMAKFNLECLPVSKPSSFCTRYWPEFQGKQIKLSQFLTKKKPNNTSSNSNIFENTLIPLNSEPDIVLVTKAVSPCTTQEKLKRSNDLVSSTLTKPPMKKSKSNSTSKQSNLLTFFKTSKPIEQQSGTSEEQQVIIITSIPSPLSISTLTESDESQSSLSNNGDSQSSTPPSKSQQQNWNHIFRPPTPAPLCKGHQEPCVLRTVKKKESLNKGRQFYVCQRAEGAKDNLEARCDHFEWKEQKIKTGKK
ncbi:unnamed protein product [Didymodactylos carnosus]|uniref:DNA-(apurinic or apyrimidinic site) endonuclease n=1 Tax=Didymodactylos carnosus TaxID=1234261 RepID=A0A8S2GT91_9BILA|nr:unnamed protein product [Didymodactylos carnosus]CAF3557767.1 unnamed protein product [Didymodactylos carnosus]